MVPIGWIAVADIAAELQLLRPIVRRSHKLGHELAHRRLRGRELPKTARRTPRSKRSEELRNLHLCHCSSVDGVHHI